MQKKKAKARKKEPKVFKGEYVGVGDEEKVKKAVVKADTLPNLYMTGIRPTTEREATRIIRRNPPRITPKTPRLRR